MSDGDDDLLQCNAADFFFGIAKPEQALAPVQVKDSTVVPAQRKNEAQLSPRDQFIHAVQEYLALLQNEQKLPSADHLVNTLTLMQTKIKFLGMDKNALRKLHYSTAVIDDFTGILRAACSGNIDRSYLEPIKQVRDKFGEQFRKNLGQEINMLLAELQIPFLKIAFIDSKLLDNDAFPGNSLFTAIVRLGETVPADKILEDPVYRECRGALRHILKDFESDVSLFTSLLQSSPLLNKQMAPGAEHISPPKKSNVVKAFRADVPVTTVISGTPTSADLVETPASRVIAEISTAPTTDPDTITYILEKNQKGKKLPPKVVNFTSSTWKDVLVQTLEMHGENSQAFRRAVELVEGLTWITDMQLNLQDSMAIKQMYAEIWLRLDDGLREIKAAEAQKEEICKMMLDLFLDRMVS